MAAKAKLQANVQAVAAHDTAANDASAARTWPISVHLTSFAPGCERVGIEDKRRWRTFYGKTPNEAVRSTLARLRLSPSAVTVATQANGDLDLMAPAPPELERFLSSETDGSWDGRPVPFATFWDGLTAPQLQAELETLRRAGWTPPAPLPADA